MVQLASQLVQRQSGKYDAADLEDRYETRLRAMIDAKLKGEGIDASEPEAPERTNVVDLMAALKHLARPGGSRETRSGEEKVSRQGHANQATSGSIGQTETSLSAVSFFPPL